ncbi:LacI family DNA-binding transcriptional regulator [Microbacterium nymphoidis]|uniref:LacI family DNA-binding transcriptional regulator n=1 Tax=Microbacterium nymphoidis TaxID=2898586 RepID=UPI001E47D7D8|nr:LacI family DNA-binding transcriptional regulator [Microbacterium nymphoidis]MCD2499400.1 LacI family transcriptional regulator [Microbacterium nymphoidis]
MGRAPTVEDVARRAGVSRQTVSNVLNSPDIVRPATRERVAAAIEELGYRTHAAARMLRTQRSSTIGIHLDPYVGGVSGVVLDRFVHALAERASDRGMRILVYAARTPEEEVARLTEITDGGEIDAAVLTGTFRGDPRASFLASRRLPFVAFGRPWDDGAEPAHPWVDVDGAAGTRQATEHALTHGSRVAFLGWPEGSGTGDDRERGWREAMAAASATGPRWSSVDDVAAARDVAAAGIGDVDAVVCASDSLAIGALLAAAAAGRGALPIIGFDNTPAAEALGLSSVEQRPEKVAGAVLRLLMGPDGRHVLPASAGPQPAEKLVAPELVIRTR